MIGGASVFHTGTFRIAGVIAPPFGPFLAVADFSAGGVAFGRRLRGFFGRGRTRRVDRRRRGEERARLSDPTGLQENRHTFFGEKLVTTRQQREGRALLRRRQRRAGRRPGRAARSVGIGQRQQVRLCAATRERVELHLNLLYRAIEDDLALKLAAIPFEVFRFLMSTWITSASSG